MKALVTGSAGFIGSYVAATLAGAGYEVTGVDVADEHSPLDAREFFRQDASYREYDAVVHCAAVVGGRRVVEWTPLHHAANLEIDAALFAWAQRAQPGRVVYFSSSCAYPKMLGRVGATLREDDIAWPPRPQMMPDELYGWTKLTGEFVANTARDAGIPVSIVRPFSVYGPVERMNDGFAVRGFMEQAQRKADPIVIWGDDRQTRDFIHVTDVANAVLAMIREGISGPVNLGTGRGTSLAELAAMIGKAAGYSPQIKVDGDMPAGIRRLVADPSRLHGFYTPKVALKDFLVGAFSQ